MTHFSFWIQRHFNAPSRNADGKKLDDNDRRISDLGFEQGRDIARVLPNIPKNWISSPSLRAQHSAQIMGGSSCHLEVEPLLYRGQNETKLIEGEMALQMSDLKAYMESDYAKEFKRYGKVMAQAVLNRTNRNPKECFGIMCHALYANLLANALIKQLLPDYLSWNTPDFLDQKLIPHLDEGEIIKVTINLGLDEHVVRRIKVPELVS